MGAADSAIVTILPGHPSGFGGFYTEKHIFYIFVTRRINITHDFAHRRIFR
ncbi:hypothetical protein HMPREF0742_00825 [Rothia aeria F0184]|uniref:Uncharacterized protein n=1 Tax=Rothia aeria F0184 TaxID=888019 RepID=U7V6J6_9MICC|nr:hypothetical protein HMPREF0742_00825 [Rothia aeria F0184]